MSSSFINQNGWKHYLLRDARNDVMRSFDWAARRFIDNENQEIPKEFQKWYEKFVDCSIEDQIFHGHEVREVYWDILKDLHNDLEVYLEQRQSITPEEARDTFWESKIEEAFFEYLEAYKTLSYENLFEEAVYQNKYSENESSKQN